MPKPFAHRLACAAAVFAVLAASRANATELVLNGGFEGAPALTGWTFTAAATGSDFLVGDWCGTVSCFSYEHIGNGTHTGANAMNFLGTTSNDTISETFATSLNATYTISFWLLISTFHVPGGALSPVENAFTASWGGVTLLPLANTPNADPTWTYLIGENPWVQYSFVMSALTTSTTLSFGAFNRFGVTALDDVSVDEVLAPTPPEVPEPATMLLVGTGLTCIWRSRRRRRDTSA